MNANELISRMTDIEAEMKIHERALADLRSEGQGLFAEFESWRAGLTFAHSATPKAKVPKGEGRDDLKTGLKLAVKRAIQKAIDGASAEVVGLAAARRYVEKQGVELPGWVDEWTNKYIGKTYPQPQGETPGAEAATKEIEPEPAGTVEPPKASKKRKK